MVAALDLVPGVAPDAVVAVADALDDGQALVDQALVDQVRGDLVLDAGPDLVGVEEGQPRPAALRPGAEEQARLVVEGVDPLHVGEFRKSSRKLCWKMDRAAVLTRSARGSAEARHRAQPLAEQLVGRGSPRRTGISVSVTWAYFWT